MQIQSMNHVQGAMAERSTKDGSHTGSEIREELDMGKAVDIDRFKVGERVTFVTNMGSHRFPVVRQDFGTILKLHKSGSRGVASIKPKANDIPGTFGRTVNRRMQCVSKI